MSGNQAPSTVNELDDWVESHCPECGAPIPEGGSCRDNFHALLALEAEVPGAAGSLTHFFTVATYNLQHPVSMGFSAAALHGLREAHTRALDCAMTVAQLRAAAKAGAAAAGRVMRTPDDPVPAWPTGSWPMSCMDVVAGGAAGFPERLREWARSVREKLDRELDRKSIPKNADSPGTTSGRQERS